MISHNPDTNCTDARLYYYDFLSNETRRGIPEGALQHIMQCRNCQSEMDRLKDLLTKADAKCESEQSRKDSAISTLLRLHFEYIGEPVKCDTVKPFLASLADPVLDIRIPTPITTHVNKCNACRDDLQELLDMHLPHKYLCRLGQLLAEKPIEDKLNCSKAQAAIPAVVSLAFHETDAETLKHLCTCSNCRKQLYLHRESIRKELLLNSTSQNGFQCDAITAVDIYDYCLPYGIDPANDEYAEFRESLTSHLSSCPKCLAKIQQLHFTISNIVERAESEMVTTYNIDESESNAGLPIDSETTGTEDNLTIEQPKTINLTSRLKEKATAWNIKPMLKIGIAAAAVIVIGLALLFNTPTAKAVTLDQLCKAIEKVRNVYIAKFGPDKEEPTQEMWVSRSLNIYMITNTSEGLVLWDTDNKLKKTKQPDKISPELTMLSDKECNQIETKIAGFLELLPFDNMSDMPKDTNWNPETNDSLKVNEENQEVYKLTWIEKTPGGSSVFRMRKYFVDPGTDLPSTVELYQKFTAEDDYTFQAKMDVKSLQDVEIQDKVEKVFP